MMCLWACYEEKYEEKNCIASLKKGVGSVSQRYGTGNPDPPKISRIPQHWKKQYLVSDYDIFMVLAGLQIRIRVYSI